MSLRDYHKSTNDELLALTNKVRNLVTHWGEDGRYKEAVLKNVIRKFLPDKYAIATGFVIKPDETRGDHLISKQIDLLIYSNDSPVLFKEGDFVIITPDSVKGIIEVKANLQNQNITDVIRQANENGEFIFSGKENKTEVLFNGVFSFEGYTTFNKDTFITNYLRGNENYIHDENFFNYKVNHVSLNKDWFIKVWNEETEPHSLYNIKDLSFSFFISNLVASMSPSSVQRNRYIWYATDKELNLKKSF